MKVANSYASLLRGVSQQVPQDRAEGQHTEQVNMLSDPVNGLSRRHGSQWQGEQLMAGLMSNQLAAYKADLANWCSYDFDYLGNEYLIAYRKGDRPLSANPLPPVLVYNKTTGQFLTYTRPGVDTALDSLEVSGISALTAVGRYLFAASNVVATSGQSVEKWNTVNNLAQAVVWVRGGAFSRTYQVTLRLQNGTARTVTYTTPPSSYQGTLSTASIPYNAVDYTKRVNDLVNDYNSAVTAHIGTSTAAVQPSAIAVQLQQAFAALGITASVVGSHVCFNTAVLASAVEVDDGGDGSLIRGVADEVESADKVSVVHHAGKVIKVRSKAGGEAYYLKAVPKDASVTSGYTEVTWQEAAGVEHTINGGLYYATISGNAFYLASSATLLGTIIAGPHPEFSVSTSGDHDSSPMPFWVGRKITYLGTFQNRLLVGSGGALAVSQTDDYLNFFRTTVLTLPADNPFEMLPQGSEDDELRYSCLYDQDLVVFGKRRQYVISGATVLAPTSANMTVLATYEGVADAAPVAAGGYIFFTKRGAGYSNVFQLQPGQNDKSPEAFPASSQVDKYIAGGVIEMLSVTGSPSLLFLRTASAQSSLYTFAYLDKQDGRKMDSWSRWEFNEALGPVAGVSASSDGVLLMTLRVGAAGVYVVVDMCPLSTGLSETPYLDSQREYADVAAGTGSVTTTSGAEWAASFDDRSNRRLTGVLLPSVASLLATYPAEPGLLVGALQEAYVTPTNPFMRDGKDKAILTGRLTITRFVLGFKESTGFDWSLMYKGVLMSSVTFNGRVLGDPNNIVGIEPISTGQYSLPVGRETRQFSLTISARRWFPLTITALEWGGQFFNRVQRF